MNEQIARGDGERRLDDLRVIEVDAREDGKCVCVCVRVCMYVYVCLKEGFRQAESVMY